MTIVKQMSLFDIRELLKMESSRRFDAILATFDVQPIFQLFRKKTMRGAPRELNYGAMIQSLMIRIVERIPTVKDLVNRLTHDFVFRLDCGFLVSDTVPSEASYSRMVDVISQSDVLDRMHDELIQAAFTEGFLEEEHLSFDATHFEARDAAKPAEKKETQPKKRGRKSKEERAAWLAEQAELEANQTTFEKKLEAQLTIPLTTLWQDIPIEPKWGIKKNSDGKNTFWYGFKGHLAVSTKSQYIVARLMSSGNLSDSKAAIPLLKKMNHIMPNHFTTAIFDAGYDYEAIYRQISIQEMKAVIPYVKRREGEMIGFDEHFRPTCVREHSYCYDSFDEKYQTLKFTRPKDCATCPLRDDSLCQKVFKIKCETDIRKYTFPARGSELWKKLYKERTAVERVNAYLKQFFQLNNVRHKTGRKAKLHFNLVTFIYNACKLAVDRMNVRLQLQNNAA
ncbi:transposase [Lysinibacillus macroides]|uniref:Transposase n=6 Tax=Bacillales TaxID=1385 RepID=A0A0M9DGQ7_9BACI|nr:transposase [Lysinibacillus macroides]KOY80253.1 transposase [Lysinibacillus macroides]KOY81300.1 transposase [Lysinibacillus macroides]KOY81656.1 transposase [Lysinibacillus macroides]KOY82142.1 transposase [Lysinibacillus macroides]KOY82155.1 transposase [Lysinibacillus macroides]